MAWVRMSGKKIPSTKYIYKNGVFNFPCDNGINKFNAAFAYSAYTVNPTNLVANLSSNSTCKTLNTTNLIDLTEYNTISVVTQTDGIKSLDISDITGSYYIYADSIIGGSGDKTLQIGVCSSKAQHDTNRAKFYSHNGMTYPITITEIYLSK